LGGGTGKGEGGVPSESVRYMIVGKSHEDRRRTEKKPGAQQCCWKFVGDSGKTKGARWETKKKDKKGLQARKRHDLSIRDTKKHDMYGRVSPQIEKKLEGYPKKFGE